MFASSTHSLAANDLAILSNVCANRSSRSWSSAVNHDVFSWSSLLFVGDTVGALCVLLFDQLLFEDHQPLLPPPLLLHPPDDPSVIAILAVSVLSSSWKSGVSEPILAANCLLHTLVALNVIETGKYIVPISPSSRVILVVVFVEGVGDMD